MSGQIYFVSGIDTEIGKTYATGFLAKLWTEQGKKSDYPKTHSNR